MIISIQIRCQISCRDIVVTRCLSRFCMICEGEGREQVTNDDKNDKEDEKLPKYVH